MLETILVFAAGVVLGAILGAILMAIMAASGRSSDVEERATRNGMGEHK